MKRALLPLFIFPIFSGCVGLGVATFGTVVGTPDSSGLIGAGVSRQERMDFPFGARWVKEGMTRDHRKADWMECGGAADLQDGFRTKFEFESFDSYWKQLSIHNNELWKCMTARNYHYFNDGYAFGDPKLPGNNNRCDTRCLYP